MWTCGEDPGPLQLLSGTSSAATSPRVTQRGKPNEPLLKHKGWVCGQASGASLNRLDIIEWQEE